MSRPTNAIMHTRKLAIEAGLETYQGQDCVHKHGGLRFTIKAGGSCVLCYQRAKEKAGKRQKERYQQELVRWMLYRAERRAKEKGLAFNITEKDISIPDNCPVLGTPIEKASLDRKDNSKGYVKGNVFVISHKANSLKANATISDLEKILVYMRS